MGKHRKRKRPKKRPAVGAPPGVMAAPEGATATKVRVLAYDAERLVEADGVAALKHLEQQTVTWVDIVGLGSLEIIQAVADKLSLHPLAMEDVLHTHQRPKVEDYPGSLFIVTRAVREHEGAVDIEQISMFVGERFVVTFQEREGDAFDPVRDRIRQAKGRIRTMGASYLAYALLDAGVDAMFPVIEALGDRLERLETEVFDHPVPSHSERIHDLKYELLDVRRAVLPLRESLNRLLRDESPYFDREVKMYLRDCYDHLTQLLDQLEGQRELSGALKDAYLSSLGHRSNEVMKVLTMVSTIFIPMGFLAGLYGMNFNPEASPYNMPELSFPYGYPALLAVMVVLAGGMLGYFRRRGWL